MQKLKEIQSIIGNGFITENWYYILIALVSLIFVVFVILKYIKPQIKKKNEAKKQLKVDEDYLENIVKALGGKNNIINSTLNNKRLHVNLKNSKEIDAKLLKELELAAVLTKNEIKILVKYDNNIINKYLNSLNKGEKNE